MKKSLLDQMGTAQLDALAIVVGADPTDAPFRNYMRDTPPLLAGFTIGDAARAYLLSRLASIAPAAKHPDGVGAKAALVSNWLTYQDEALSFGLRSVADAERLYDFWQSYEDTLPEYADEDDVIDPAPYRVAALGYDPLARPEK